MIKARAPIVQVHVDAPAPIRRIDGHLEVEEENELPMNEYIRALEKEQEAWRALDGRLPGMSGCSPALWADWMDAVARLNVEVARCTQTHQREAMSAKPPRRDSHRGSGPART